MIHNRRAGSPVSKRSQFMIVEISRRIRCLIFHERKIPLRPPEVGQPGYTARIPTRGDLFPAAGRCRRLILTPKCLFLFAIAATWRTMSTFGPGRHLQGETPARCLATAFQSALSSRNDVTAGNAGVTKGTQMRPGRVRHCAQRSN